MGRADVFLIRKNVFFAFKELLVFNMIGMVVLFKLAAPPPPPPDAPSL